MDTVEYEQLLGDIETKLDRLKALYEQWFQGMERLEPHIPRKDIERRIQMLRREQVRNTALRFRFNQLLQRWTTYTTYWGRVARQIEEGTYRRDVMKMRAQREAARQNRKSERPRGPIELDLEADSKLDNLFGGKDVESALDSLDEVPTNPPPAKGPRAISPFALRGGMSLPPPAKLPLGAPPLARGGTNAGAKVPIPPTGAMPAVKEGGAEASPLAAKGPSPTGAMPAVKAPPLAGAMPLGGIPLAAKAGTNTNPKAPLPIGAAPLAPRAPAPGLGAPLAMPLAVKPNAPPAKSAPLGAMPATPKTPEAPKKPAADAAVFGRPKEPAGAPTFVIKQTPAAPAAPPAPAPVAVAKPPAPAPAASPKAPAPPPANKPPAPAMPLAGGLGGAPRAAKPPAPPAPVPVPMGSAPKPIAAPSGPGTLPKAPPLAAPPKPVAAPPSQARPLSAPLPLPQARPNPKAMGAPPPPPPPTKPKV